MALYLLAVLGGVWVTGEVVGALHDRWYVVVGDLAPCVVIAGAIARAPHLLAGIAARMKDYERSAGLEPGDEDPSSIAL